MAVALEEKTSRRPRRRRAGRPLTSDVAAREEDLLDRATEVFLEHGYANGSVTEIACRAGASKRTIYARYPTKEALFIAAITRKTRELQDVFAQILAPEQPLGTVLEDFGKHLLCAISHPKRRSLFRVFVAESGKFPRLSKAFWEIGPKRSVAMLRDFLAQHPEFHGKDPEYAAEMFWSLCCGFTFMRSQLHQSVRMPDATIQDRVKEAVRMFLAAYTVGQLHY